MTHTNLLILEAAEAPSDAPSWITQAYLEACVNDQALQTTWKPAVGDWYFCRDHYMVLRIDDLESYNEEGDCALPTDLGKDEHGRWRCDIYLPPPADEAAQAPSANPPITSWLDMPQHDAPY
jgi:hypothetical protein